MFASLVGGISIERKANECCVMWVMRPDTTRITAKRLEPLSMCAAWTTRYAHIIIIRLSIREMCLTWLPLFRSFRTFDWREVCVGASFFVNFFLFSSAFSNLIGSTMDFVVSQPVRTLCMHCFFQLLQWDTCHAWWKCVFENRNCHIARICANARWKMTHAMPQHGTWEALGDALWWRRCQQMNDSSLFFLVKGQNNEREWRKWNEMEKDGRRV